MKGSAEVDLRSHSDPEVDVRPGFISNAEGTMFSNDFDQVDGSSRPQRFSGSSDPLGFLKQPSDAGSHLASADAEFGEKPDQMRIERTLSDDLRRTSLSMSLDHLESDRTANVHGLLVALQAAHRSVTECQNELRLSIDEFQAYRRHAEARILDLERTVHELQFQRDLQSSISRQGMLQSFCTLSQTFMHFRMDMNTLKESVVVCGDFFTLSLKKLGYRLNEALLRNTKLYLRNRKSRTRKPGTTVTDDPDLSLCRPHLVHISSARINSNKVQASSNDQLLQSKESVE